jgi:hypothetical protein
MDLYGLLWMDYYGSLWISMDFYGLLWTSSRSAQIETAEVNGFAMGCCVNVEFDTAENLILLKIWHC